MQSWMFLSSFEKLRTRILKEQTISSMLHLGPRTFDELSGEVVQNTAFVIEKKKPTEETGGNYCRLIDGKNCKEKEDIYLNCINQTSTASIRFYTLQSKLAKLPGNIFGYWLGDNSLEVFTLPPMDDKIIQIRQGLASGDNERFFRLWYEVPFSKIGFGKTSCDDFLQSKLKWAPHNRGGAARKWFGVSGDVIAFDRDNYNDLLNLGNHLPSKQLYFKEGIIFSRISTKYLNARYAQAGATFDGSAPLAYTTQNLEYILGFMNSRVIEHLLKVLCPTLTFQVGDVRRVPYKMDDHSIKEIVDLCIDISKLDWDAHETSWDFKENELVRIFKDNGWGSLQTVVEEYKNEWSRLYNQLHTNEVELNRQFIDIYGLKDELSPEVPLNEVTILQQGEVKVTDQYTLTTEDDIILTDEKGRHLTVTGDTYLDWQDDVIIKQLISYIVGVWMGRYRLDRPGLNIAHPNPTEEELAGNEVNGKTLAIDSDAIIPILPKDAPFPDNLINYIEKFVRTVFDEEDANENLNFIETCLGKSIEAYLDKDFWKDHKKMYQNRPIYWLFSSKKGAFKAIVYVHRMDKYTVEQVRAKYLLPYIGYTERQIESLEKREGSLSTAERKELDRRRAELADMREYHDRLQQRAAEVAAWPDFIDLDDGIIANHAKFGDILSKIK